MMEQPVFGNRYRVTSELGRGPYATTYLVSDTESGHDRALKRIVLPADRAGRAADLFLAETADLSRLDHPRLPAFTDCWVEKGADTWQIFLVEDYIRGKSLATLVAEGKRFNAVELVRIALDLSQVLQYLQAINPPWVHRDITPRNVLLTGDRKAYLVDLAAVNDVMRQAGIEPPDGTKPCAFMAPEQLSGQHQPASDVYSLGATLIYALSQQDPTQLGTSLGELDFQDRIHVLPEFKAVLATMVRHGWRERFQKPQDLRDAMTALMAPKLPVRSGVSGRLGLLAGACAAVMAVLVLVLRFRH